MRIVSLLGYLIVMVTVAHAMHKEVENIWGNCSVCQEPMRPVIKMCENHFIHGDCSVRAEAKLGSPIAKCYVCREVIAESEVINDIKAFMQSFQHNKKQLTMMFNRASVDRQEVFIHLNTMTACARSMKAATLPLQNALYEQRIRNKQLQAHYSYAYRRLKATKQELSKVTEQRTTQFVKDVAMASIGAGIFLLGWRSNVLYDSYISSWGSIVRGLGLSFLIHCAASYGISHKLGLTDDIGFQGALLCLVNFTFFVSPVKFLNKIDTIGGI